MRYSVVVQFVCLALLTGGCVVEVDDPVAVPEEPDVFVPPPDATSTAWPTEEKAPERSRAHPIGEARALAPAADEKAATLPSALLHPIVQGPAACIKCLNLPSQPRLPQPGDLR